MLPRILLLIFVAKMALNDAVLAHAQSPKVSARELFYISTVERTPGEKVATKPLGLRYSIQKEGLGGRFAEVDPDTVFRTGDHVKLTVEANDSGYLYIVQQGASGKWKVLFPREPIAGGNRIEKNRREEIPRDTYFNVADPAGDEKLFVVLSREPESDWERLIRSVGGQPGSEPKRVETASVDDPFIDRAKQSLSARDLVYEKVSGPSGNESAGKELAVYIVNVAGKARGRVQAEITLKHR